MSTENNLQTLYENSIKILTDLIAFKTVSGEDNNSSSSSEDQSNSDDPWGDINHSEEE